MFSFSRLFAKDIMRFMISSDTILGATEEFLDWRVFGFFFSFVNVMFRALFIGITRTKVLTLNAVVMALTNVQLDYLLIFGKGGFPEMGIKGAAIASVIAEGCRLFSFLVYTRLTVDIKEICIESIPVVRHQAAETGVKYFYIYHVTVFYIVEHLFHAFCCRGASGATGVGDCQYCAQCVYRSVDSG